jgi:hypothetical protein
MARLPPNLHATEPGAPLAPRAAWTAPAMGVRALTGFPLGYATLSPFKAALRSAVIVLIPFIFWFLWGLLTRQAPPANEGRAFLIDYAVLAFGMTLLRFIARAIGQNFGQEVHSAETGYSLVTHILFFLPAALTEQFIVPGLLGWAGWQISHSLSFDLGVWLMISAVSYFILANYEMRGRAARRRAPVDDKIRAGLFVTDVDTHEEKVKVRQRRQKGRGVADPLYAAGEAPDIAEYGHGKRRA